WPVAGWLTSSYGNRTDPFTHDQDFHPGLDISADYGQPVVATGDATVAVAGPNGAYGNMVALDHGFGIVTKYGHLSRITVTADQRELKRLTPVVAQINALEPSITALGDEQLRGRTAEFRLRLEQGETLEDLLPEAFAVVREAGRRVLNMRHFDVQLIGGMVL